MKLMGLMALLTIGILADDGANPDLKANLQPANLVFSGLEADIETYVKSFPEERQKIESRRAGIVKNFKKMVQKVVNRRPYEGKIFLKGKVIIGKIMEAKDEALTIVDSKDTSIDVKWEDLNLRQYSEIFILEAISKGKELSAVKRPENADAAFKKAANYYFALAVFYDWYGNETAASIFKSKALILNPEKQEEIDQLWPPVDSLKN